MAYSARNQAFCDAWRSRAIEPARVALLALIKRGEKMGVLRQRIDPEAGLALLLGPMIYRKVFVLRLGKKLPKNFEAFVADAFLGAFGTGRSGGRAAGRT